MNSNNNAIYLKKIVVKSSAIYAILKELSSKSVKLAKFKLRKVT